MSSSLVTAHLTRPGGRRPEAAPGRSRWLPTWSVPAAMRALRATIVVPGLFALTGVVIGDPQMAVFAAFGGFATLVIASFGGTRRDQAFAHLGLALAGSALLVIGTLVSSSAWLAAVVTVPVGFFTLFAQVAGPNAGSGVLAALLAYILPAASPGSGAAIPSRLAGWWLASVAGTAAVLLLSPRPPGDRLRATAARVAGALAEQLAGALRGGVQPGMRDASIAAKHELMSAFSGTPYRPTGLATADQALANAVELLEWCAGLISDALDGAGDLSRAAPEDRALLAAAGTLLRDVASLLAGEDAQPDLARPERGRAASAAHLRALAGADGQPATREAVATAFYARAVALAARSAAADALIAARRADPETIAAQHRQWYGGPDGPPAGRRRGRPAERRLAGLAGALGIAFRHASIRSVWFQGSARGTLALTASVAVADLSDVQHGFWVVLGAMSCLRTNASATESSALRALTGTVIGFIVGAGLILAVGTAPVSLWAALPLAVLVASYAPGTAPFAVGQAGFTLVVVVLFNLLAPVGWTVGLLRIQDVAIGCAVSVVAGVLLWPRGAGSVVGDDLADAFRSGGAYLRQAVDWALGVRREPPDAGIAAVTAGTRLDDALRAYLTEQGSKPVTKPDLWSLVMATTRLRLTAHSLAGLPGPGGGSRPGSAAIGARARELAGFYEQVAGQVGRPGARAGATAGAVPGPLKVPALAGLDSAAGPRSGGPRRQPGCELWVRAHLRNLGQHAYVIPGPAARVAELRRLPWWRP